MSGEEEKLELAAGGVPEKQSLETNPFETTYDSEFDQLRDRMSRLSAKDRRRTMEKFAQIFPDIDSTRSKQQVDSLVRHPPPPINDTVPASASGGQQVQYVPIEHLGRKLKNFSGNSKPGPGEVDYKHWRRSVTRLIEDRELTEAQKKRVILQSLVHQAEDVVDPHRSKASREIIELLDKIYGSTIDGGDLLAEFYQRNQGPTQTASEFLNRLFVELSEVIAVGGLPMSELPKTLMGQFLRGTYDEDLINKLRLDDLIDIPAFPDLLLKVRTEESKRTQRRLRHKKIIKTQTVTYDTTNTDTENQSTNKQKNDTCAKLSIPNSKDNEVIQLQQRITQLESSLKQNNKHTKQKWKIFCYRCGEDSHFATNCENPPNEKLVKQKIETRKRGN